MSANVLTLRFEVKDTGIGIDAEEMESLFEPFIQSSNRQISQEGTGLGLPISRQFVQLMGGDMQLNSTPGVGSIFIFTIPVTLTNADLLPVPVLPQPVLGLAPGQPTYRILVVEDSDTNRLLLVQLLQSIGFEVQEATHGREAIALWQSWHPHLVWMYIRMPTMYGDEAIRQIRAIEQQHQGTGAIAETASPTRIIALTAAFEEDWARLLPGYWL